MNQNLALYVNSFFSPLLICFLAFASGYAQTVSISGKVVDENDQALAFANVLLFAQDTTLLHGTATEDMGAYKITLAKRGNYLVQATYLGNKSEFLPITVANDTVLGVLVINTASQLDEVVVEAQKPRIERKVDRLVYHIENTALSDSEIWEVLRKTPAVLIVNDQLTVKGSSAVGILINGRKVHLPAQDIINLLSGTSASSVEAIEVITAPPAKYSAEDNALINIKMKKNLIAGYNGAVYNRYVQGVLPKHTVGTDHYFKGKKTDFSFNYNFAHAREVTKYTDVTNFFENGSPSITWEANQEYVLKRKKHNFSAFFDYQLSERSQLNLSAITIWQPDVSRDYKTLTDIEGDNLLAGFDTYNFSTSKYINTSYYLDFEQQLNDAGAEISLSGHYTFFDTTKGQALEANFFDTSGNFSTENDFLVNTEQYINLYSLQTDYVTPFGKSFKMETGLRYAGIASKNIVLQRGVDFETPGVNPTEAGTFSYDEHILAAYASVNGRWGDWRLKSGLRAEYTETKGSWNQGNIQNQNNYLKLFPTFSIRYTPNNLHDFNAYYLRRITRPRYNLINPFQIFQSNFSTIEGNPNLIPSTDSYVAAGYTFKKTYTIEFFYKNKTDGIGQFVFQDNDFQWLRFLSFNMDREYAYGADLIYNKEVFKFWDTYVLASLYQQHLEFTDLESGLPVINEGFSWFARANNNFTFLQDKSLTANLSLNWRAPLFFKNAEYDSYGSIDLSFRKSLWNKKASLTIGVDDIFNQGNIFSTRNFLTQSGTSFQRTENRLFSLAFRYKFGNSKIRSNSKRKRVDERNRL